MPDAAQALLVIWAWRHPRAEGAAGRCIGRTDLPIDCRKARRLARRIQSAARRHSLPRVVHTSPMRRCADVGRWLRRWGWKHHIDAALLEMDFGAWEGLSWSTIPRAEIDAWCDAFTTHAPGGGETLAGLLARVASWTPVQDGFGPIIVVAHAGWILARGWLNDHGDTSPQVAQWPRAPGFGELRQVGIPRLIPGRRRS